MKIETKTCTHQIIYYGVVNININKKTIGSVDVWSCVLCKKKFCEEKQLGIESISDIVGMPNINNDEKWAITICKLQKGKNKWRLVKLKKSSIIQHVCLNEKIVQLIIENHNVCDIDHKSILIDNNINKAIEI